jgi:hypothetical protein
MITYKSYDDLNHRRRNEILSEGARFLEIPRKREKKKKIVIQEIYQEIANFSPKSKRGAKPYCCSPPL